MKRKLIFCMVWMMLCMPVMTACAKNGQQSGASSDPSSDTVSVDDGRTETVGDADFRAASETIQQFFQAASDGDEKRMRDLSTIEHGAEFSAVTGNPMTKQETEEQTATVLQSFEKLEHVKITDGEFCTSAVETYAYYLEESAKLNKELQIIGDTDVIAASEKLFKPIDKIYSFMVEMKAGDQESREQMYVIHTPDDAWKLDVGWLQSMVDYQNYSRVLICNFAAVNAADAVNNAVTDLDAEDAGIAALDGEYHFDGEQLVSVGENTELSDLDKKLAEKLVFYYGDIRDLVHVYFRMEKGELKLLCVQREFGGVQYFGTWPHSVDARFMNYFNTIEDVLSFVENGAPENPF